MAYSHLETEIETQAFTAALARLYGLEKSEEAKNRCKEVINGFRETFRNDAEALFSAPGRTEIGGNHTDHQHGRVLAAAINLDILAAAAPNHSGLIRVKSQGYPIIEIDVRELDPRVGEVNTSAALLRGVANRIVAMGCSLEGCGLDAYMVSSVPKGSGLSSSAAFEVLIGTMLNEFFGEGRRTPVELAKIGQYAENEFFGKPCGLMDQLASAVGGVIAVDFADISDPKVTQLEVDLHSAGYALCILDSGAGHEELMNLVQFAVSLERRHFARLTRKISFPHSRRFAQQPAIVLLIVLSMSMQKTAVCRRKSRRCGLAILRAFCH